MKLFWTLSLKCLLLASSQSAHGQTIDRESIEFLDTTNLCDDDIATATRTACLTLPPDSTHREIDLFFLLDDSENFVFDNLLLQTIVEDVMEELGRDIATADIAYGVGRFADFGGDGRSFTRGNNERTARPFILNQPIISSTDAGGDDALKTLIFEAVGRTSGVFPGRPDSPHSMIEALYQVATGAGFDGNDDNSFYGNNGRQTIGRSRVETNPDNSGDVPDFASIDTLNSVTYSGEIGGAGFRPNAIKIVIVGSNICSIAPFDTIIPLDVSTSFDTVFSSDFACSLDGRVPRFGLLGDIAPENAHTVPETVAELAQRGIQVVGMAPNAFPHIRGSGPSDDPSVIFSALARLTGAVNGGGIPRIIPTSTDSTAFQQALVSTIKAMVVKPANIQASHDCVSLIGGMVTVAFANNLPRSDVDPGDQVCWDITFSRDSSMSSVLGGECNLSFQDTVLGITYGELPVTFECLEGVPVEPDEVTSFPTFEPTSSPTMAPSSEPTASPTTSIPTSVPTGPSFSPTATEWLLRGAAFFGDAANQALGQSVALSQDGSILAIGAVGTEGAFSGEAAGRVQVFRYDDGDEDWVQLGQNIDGEASGDGFGQAVALSANGLIVAAGATLSDGSSMNAGHVRVFEYMSSGSEWRQLGRDIDGEATGDRSGQSVALSQDGFTVAVGATLNDAFGNSQAGHVRVYRYSPAVFGWIQRGGDIDGVAATNFFGQSVALSASGDQLVVGAPFNSDGGSFAGHARVFSFDLVDEEWDQVGQTITGDVGFGFSGNSVDISTDGNVVAVGAYGDDGLSGNLRVYELQGANWVPRGQEIIGEAGGETFGFKVSLSDDGTVVASGGFGASRSVGVIRVFDYDGVGWTQLGDDINGGAVEEFGRAVALSGDGRVIAGGANSNDQGPDNSGVNNAGAVRVFSRL